MSYLNEKVAYIKGLSDGLELDTTTKEGKVLNAIVDVLEEFADLIDELDYDLSDLEETVDELDEDMMYLEDAVIECCEGECICPECGEMCYCEDEECICEVEETEEAIIEE